MQFDQERYELIVLKSFSVFVILPAPVHVFSDLLLLMQLSPTALLLEINWAYPYNQKGTFLYLKWAFPKVLKGMVPKIFPGPSPPDRHHSLPPPTSWRLAPPLVSFEFLLNRKKFSPHHISVAEIFILTFYLHRLLSMFERMSVFFDRKMIVIPRVVVVLHSPLHRPCSIAL